MNISKLNNMIDGKRITKAKVIRETGISRPALDAILCGNDFKVSNLEKLAKCLSVSVGYFFDDEITEIRTAGRDYVEKGRIEHHGNEYDGSYAKDISSSTNDSVLAERIKSLEALIVEKNERINELKERIDELKSRE